MAGLMMAPRMTLAKQAEAKDRIDALIARMTIEEKAGQLNLMNDPFRWRPEGVNPGDRLDSDQAQTAADIKAGAARLAPQIMTAIKQRHPQPCATARKP